MAPSKPARAWGHVSSHTTFAPPLRTFLMSVRPSPFSGGGSSISPWEADSPLGSTCKGWHQGYRRTVVERVALVGRVFVDQQHKDEMRRRPHPLEQIGHRCALGQFNRRSVPGAAGRQVVAQRAETGNCDSHRSFSLQLSHGRPHGRKNDSARYFSIGTPTRLPYSVHEPS